MSSSQAAAAIAFLFASSAFAQEAVKPVPQEPTAEERAAARKDQPAKPVELPADAPKITPPLKPVAQEPTPEERAAARAAGAAGAEKPGAAITADEWARAQREKAGLPVAPVEAAPPAAGQTGEGNPARAAGATTPDKAAEKQLEGKNLSVGFGSPAVDAPGGLASAAPAPQHVLELSGFAILGASWTQSDPQLLYVGRNNGFTLGDARIEITARPAEKLWLFLSLDGAVASVSKTDAAQGTREVRLKDAYGIWAPGNHLRVQAGQFKAPQGVEELLEETDLKFASRSILSTGVGAPYGYAQEPLSVGRQLGIGIGTDRVPFGPGGLTAQFAVMNGNGADQLYNDAPYPSAMARGAYDIGGISIGVFGSFQPRARGEQPLVYRENAFIAGADLLLTRGPLHLMALAEWRNTHHVSTQAPAEVGVGLSGEAAYRFHFVEPAVRVTYFNPSDQIATSPLTYLTGGLNFYVPGAPGRLSVDFTHRVEASGRELTNDGIDLAAQVRF